MSIIRVPHGLPEIIERYGDPRHYFGPDGQMDRAEALQWEQQLGLVHVRFPEPLPFAWNRAQLATSIRVHPATADTWRSAFRTLAAEGLWSELHDFGGGFLVRAKRLAGTDLSTHSWGIAADFDVARNPLGETPQMDLRIVRVFQSHGFTWGGEWRRPDGQHVQLASGY